MKSKDFSKAPVLGVALGAVSCCKESAEGDEIIEL